MSEIRYLIGGGEKLSLETDRPGRNPPNKVHPYDFITARRRLTPFWENTARWLRRLPEIGCPEGQAVIAVTLHPAYLAKAYYPGSLMRDLGLRHVGSRGVFIVPERVTGASKTQEVAKAKPSPAPQIFVAGERSAIDNFARHVQQWHPEAKLTEEFRRIERVEPLSEARLKSILDKKGKNLDRFPFEVVLHASAEPEDRYILDGFSKFAKSVDAKVDASRRRHVGGLCFVPMHAPLERAKEFLGFTFLRAMRQMPELVALDPFLRSSTPGFRVQLPDVDAASQELNVAIFDGGLPADHGLDRWVKQYDAAGTGAAVASHQSHGLAVTSAFLFGPLLDGRSPSAPFSNVDHWRVVGADTRNTDFELYDVLDRIQNILESRRYEFVNISLGPATAIDDDDVNRWTSTLDNQFSDGITVATVACGNNGLFSAQHKLNRIQAPSDGVNILGVGAADRLDARWGRAPYSAVGPGRSPGYVKPDFLAFGGSPAAPFFVLGGGRQGVARGANGTSFASPLALRCGVGIRANFQEELYAPTVKALLVHHANDAGLPRTEVGWGRLSHQLEDLVTAGDGEAHVIYQRQMPETGAVRMYIPMPQGIDGNVEITATFCFYCEVNPEDSLNYTRDGLEITFRPDTHKKQKPYLNEEGEQIIPTMPPSDSFFGAADFYHTEVIRRRDAQKWETTLKATKTKRSSSLKDPAFDVTYFARNHGHNGSRRGNIRFALIITLRNKKMANIHDRILQRYQNRLVQLRPRGRIQITPRRGR